MDFTCHTQEAERVSKLQDIQAELQEELDEIDKGGFTDKTTLQVPTSAFPLAIN